MKFHREEEEDEVSLMMTQMTHVEGHEEEVLMMRESMREGDENLMMMN